MRAAPNGLKQSAAERRVLEGRATPAAHALSTGAGTPVPPRRSPACSPRHAVVGLIYFKTHQSFTRSRNHKLGIFQFEDNALAIRTPSVLKTIQRFVVVLSATLYMGFCSARAGRGRRKQRPASVSIPPRSFPLSRRLLTVDACLQHAVCSNVQHATEC
ncbi:hypothetical protein EVAR_16983_1 [Eumeta japonica]|uniref:Uncharacterized protein n=1 Tax=Eumeta variegata TaxID=151549 RepID=A0A4C1TVK2_EUMVA|nr:hypothetical protein EVAR_16983_1 [Eumeta japonica]